MKKKLLLIVLPALMALSGCTYMEHATAMKGGNFFKEDASAHNEVFGGEEKPVAFNLKQPLRSYTPGEGPLTAPKMAVQYHGDYTVGETHYYALRFVAAVNDLNVKAEWTRAAYEADGDLHGTIETRETTKAYEQLSNGGDPVAATSEGAGYNYYVVYTVYNIPISTFDDYFITAYLTLSDPENPSIKITSKVAAARVDERWQFSFDFGTTGYFLHDGSEVLSREDSPTKGSNLASFTKNIAEDEQFIIVKNDTENSKFQIWDSDCLEYSGNSDVKSAFENDGGYIKATDYGKFRLYLNNDGHLYKFKYAKTTGYYLRGFAASNGEDNWDCKAGYQFSVCPSEDNNIGELLNVTLSVGDFKISSSDWKYEWGFWGCKQGSDEINWLGDRSPRVVTGGASSNFQEGSGSAGTTKNINCKVAGNYNIYITNDNYVSFELAS